MKRSMVLLLAAFTAAAETPYIVQPDEAFQRAIDRGDAATVRLELKAGRGDANRLHRYANSPLSLAILKGHPKVVAVLLEFKADMASEENAAGFPDGWNLRCAARLYSPESEALLTKAKAPAPTAACLAEVQFVIAAKKGSERDVRAATLPEGLSLGAATLALHFAVASKKPEVVTAVIEVSGNPRLPEHAHIRTYQIEDVAMLRALGDEKAVERLRGR